jgi:tRNA-guanine family transglycosylase
MKGLSERASSAEYRTGVLETRKGAILWPSYIPVTTGDSAHATDAIVRPFLRRFADAAMQSYVFARHSRAKALGLPLFVDSGGFRLLEPGAWIEEQEDGTGAIAFEASTAVGAVERITPPELLAFQEENAELGSTLDFPIPLALTDPWEREKRLRLTVSNAQWALSKASDHLTLFGSVQGWDSESYARCASLLREAGFRHLAIGGLVPRLPVVAQVLAIVRAVVAVAPPGGLVHAFGIGNPQVARLLFDEGVTSVDSSSYVRQAVSGARWDGCEVPDGPSTLERARAALANLAYAKVSLESHVA